KRKRPRSTKNVAFIYAGNDLLSHTVSRAVQSAQRGLTSVFGMGTGGTPAVKSPTSYRICREPSPSWQGANHTGSRTRNLLKDLPSLHTGRGSCLTTE